MKTWISEHVITVMTAEANCAYPLETGGVLAGYVADNAHAVILYASGPGPKAAHRRRRFLPDHRWQCEQLNRVFDESEQQYVYLGDWHTHPDALGRMSWLDRLTLRSIAKHPDARLAAPIMLIGGGAPHGWVWLCHRYKPGPVFELLTNTDLCDLHVFVPRC